MSTEAKKGTRLMEDKFKLRSITYSKALSFRLALHRFIDLITVKF